MIKSLACLSEVGETMVPPDDVDSPEVEVGMKFSASAGPVGEMNVIASAPKPAGLEDVGVTVRVELESPSWSSSPCPVAVPVGRGVKGEPNVCSVSSPPGVSDDRVNVKEDGSGTVTMSLSPSSRMGRGRIKPVGELFGETKTDAAGEAKKTEPGREGE